MKQFSIVPNTDTGKDLWLKNFASKLPQYAGKYDINATHVADITNSSISFTYWLDYKNQVDEFNKKLTEFKNEIRDGILPGASPSVPPQMPVFPPMPALTDPGVFERAVSIANRIKKHISYTKADGKDLGIEATPAQGIDYDVVKPVIKVVLVEGNKPEVRWVKNGMDAIEIMVDRGEGYEPLAIDLRPNYIDGYQLEPGETAHWKYQAIYLKNDKRVGLFSDEASITVVGKK
jgi:hypothetical protein